MVRTTVDVTALYAALDAARVGRGLSWRQLAGELELSPSTLSRLGNGMNPDVNAFAAMVRWLNLPAESFMLGPASDEQPDLVAELAPLLRARRDLSSEDVEHLEEIIASAVRRFNADRSRRARDAEGG
ncbi:MAG TPA: helix-turn-helix domain-containing protein [Pseudonocardiaceae bacterium]